MYMTVVGLEEQVAADFTFNVYPNPVENVAWVDLNLTGSEEVRLDVVNLLGQRIMSQDHGYDVCWQQPLCSSTSLVFSPESTWSH